MTNTTVSNNKKSNNPDYVVETEDQGSGVQRQVVKVAEMPSVSFTPEKSASGNAPSGVSITTTSGLALAANANRKGLILVNDGSSAIYLAFGVAAEAAKGIKLIGGGGAFTMNEFSFSQQAINAITASGTSNLCIQEFE